MLVIEKIKNNMITGAIYVLKCPISDEIRYVGQTKQANPYKRYYQHKYQWSRSENLSHLNAWIKSLFLKNLVPIFEIIENNINILELNSKEILYIKTYKEQGLNLVNTSEGGEQDYKLFKQKLNWKEKRLNTLKTSSLWKARNKRHSDILKEKHKEPNNKIGFKAMSQAKKDSFKQKCNESRYKKVACIDNTGKIIKTFDSILQAASFYNIKDSTHIVRVCKGKSKSGITHGFKFKYV
jgi:hypothetical protein